LFINGLLKEIWEKHPGVPLPKEVENSGRGEQGIGGTESNIEGRSKLVALMLADDLVGLAESQEELQKMADTIHAYSRQWRFKLSPTKSAVVVFGPSPPNKESPKAQRQKLWKKLTSDPDVAAKCQILDGKSDEEKLHSMLNEEFWGVDVDEESGLVYGPFKHAFKCIAKYVSAAWKVRNALAHPSDVA